ncbi:MAG TPA: PEP-CTERM sorting domain-containing protein [Burkholderiaceae bacterium]|jgi:hypothetical protein
MKKFKLLLASLLFSLSGLACATTTVLDKSGTLSGLFSIDTFAFNIAQGGLYDVTFADSSKSKGFFLAGYAIDENIGGHWVQVALGGVGSSTFTATAGKYLAIIGDVAFPGKKVNFTIDVTKVPSPIPEPETWAIMLLGIGFVVYQVRPRKTRGSQAIPSFA